MSDRNPKKTNNVCFTIMPFGGWFDHYYQQIYKPAIEEAGLSPHRADDILRPGTIVNDIWAYTRQAKMVLADLSGKNPNVLYELGLAHALAKPSILVTESLDDVPFDLRALRVIEYNKNAHDWGTQLKVRITKSITEISKTPLKSILPAFLQADRGEAPPPITQHDRELLAIRQELNLLRSQVTRATAERESSVDPTEGEAFARELLSSGASEGEVTSRLVHLGVPVNWARRTVARLRQDTSKADSVPDWLEEPNDEDGPLWPSLP